MPDSRGNFKGIIVPRVPWHRSSNSHLSNQDVVVDLDPDQTDEERDEHGRGLRLAVRRGSSLVEITGPPVRETR